MLRLKQALLDCNIPQKALVTATGFGKTQVSLTLSTGKLPADADKFVIGVTKLINDHATLREWMEHNNVQIMQLCEEMFVPEDGEGGRVTDHAPTYSIDLERVLCEIAGRAVLAAEGANNLTLSLVRATSHLHRVLTDLVGEDAPFVIRVEGEVFAILKGVRP